MLITLMHAEFFLLPSPSLVPGPLSAQLSSRCGSRQSFGVASLAPGTAFARSTVPLHSATAGGSIAASCPTGFFMVSRPNDSPGQRGEVAMTLQRPMASR